MASYMSVVCGNGDTKIDVVKLDFLFKTMKVCPSAEYPLLIIEQCRIPSWDTPQGFHKDLQEDRIIPRDFEILTPYPMARKFHAGRFVLRDLRSLHVYC